MSASVEPDTTNFQTKSASASEPTTVKPASRESSLAAKPESLSSSGFMKETFSGDDNSTNGGKWGWKAT